MEKHQNTQNELGQKSSQSWGLERSINSSDAIEMLSTDSEFIIKSAPLSA